MKGILLADGATIPASIGENTISFVSPSTQRSVLRWPQQNDLATLDILLLDRLQREQREEAERQATQLMEEAIQVESLKCSVMLPSEEDALFESDQQNCLPVLSCQQNLVMRSLNNNNPLEDDISALCTPRRRNSTGGDFGSRFFTDTVSNKQSWLRLQLPQEDSQGSMDFSTHNDCDYKHETNQQCQHKLDGTFGPISLRPKISTSISMSTHSYQSDPLFPPIHSSSNSASSSSTGSPATACPTDLEDPYLARYGLPCHSLSQREQTGITSTQTQLPPPLPIPLLPMMTPEYTRPTKIMTLLDGAPDLVSFQTPPSLSVRRASIFKK